MAITNSDRNFVLLVLITLMSFCTLTTANVVLLGEGLSLQFPDLEANFAQPLRGPGIRGGGLHLAEPIDACKALTNDVEQAGNFTTPVALIIRGGCSFEDKVRKAQKAGFKAVIVHDNDDRGSLVAMAGNSAGIKIPAVFISKEAGDTLKKYADLPDMELWIVPDFENSAWSIMAMAFLSLLAMSGVLGACFCVRAYGIRQILRTAGVREFHGMSKHLVKAMPSLIFTSVLEDNSTSSTCAICLEDYKVGERLRVLPCSHKFHALCVDTWLTTWRTFCPVCKRDARTNTGIPPASESTPLLSSGHSLASVDLSSLQSSFRSSLPSTSAFLIPSRSASFRSPSRGHSLASTPAGQHSIRSYHHSPPIGVDRNYADLRNASSQRSYASHLASPHSLDYQSISIFDPRYISPSASPSIVGSSSRHYRPLHYSGSAASLSSFASANSPPEC